jgi:hypothetical protein
VVLPEASVAVQITLVVPTLYVPLASAELFLLLDNYTVVA